MQIDAPDSSCLLGEFDVLDWPAFNSRLSTGGDNTAALSPDKRIWELLPEAVRQVVRSEATAGQAPPIIAALNDVLRHPGFYNEESFTGVSLPVEAKRLLDKAAAQRTSKEHLRLNRLLIEAVYPREIIASSYQWADPARALTALCEMLGIPGPEIEAGEEPDRIHLYKREFPTANARKITEDVLRDLIESYGPAIQFSFKVGALDKLTLEGLDAKALAKFREETKDSESLILDLTLDKTALLTQWGSPSAKAVIKLFFFPAAFARAFGGNLVELESGVMSECNGNRKLVVLVPAHKTDFVLDGDYLAVVAGEYTARRMNYVPKSELDGASAKGLFDAAFNNLKWTRLELKYLTPLHFKVELVEGNTSPQDLIASAVYAQRFACSVLYTARETYMYPAEEKKGKDAVLRSTFAGDKFLADVEVQKGSKLSELISRPNGQNPFASVGALANLAEWVYSGERARARGPSDRIAVLQEVAAQYLQEHGATENCSLLLHEGRSISERVNWAFAAFTRKELDKFFAHVREIEASVDSTVKTFNEQVQSLTKTLVDNMLAAVGILVASFIAAVFKEPFEPRIFQIATTLYATYLLVFPITIGLLSTRGRYKDSKGSFARQRNQFNRRLPRDEVDKIIGNTVTGRQCWFEKWFLITTTAYLAVLGILVLAIFTVPAYVNQFEDHFSVAGAAFSPSTGQLVIRGSHFRKEKEIVVSLGDKSYTNLNSQSLIVHSSELLTLGPTRRDLDGRTKILIRQGNAPGVEVELPTPPPLALPKVDRWDPVSVGDSKTVAAWGSNFDAIESIRFNGKQMPHSTSPDGTLMHVIVSSPMTDQPGEKRINFGLVDGDSVEATITVKPVRQRAKPLDRSAVP